MIGQDPFFFSAWLTVGLLLMFGGPLLISWWCVRLEPKGQYHRRLGVFGGLAVAAWATTCWFAIPYCGVYVQLPYLLISFAFRTIRPDVIVDGWVGHLTLIVSNFVFWPFLGAMYDVARQAARGAR